MSPPPVDVVEVGPVGVEVVELGADSAPTVVFVPGVVQVVAGGAATQLLLTRTAGAGGVGGHRVVTPSTASVVGYAANDNAAHLGRPLWLSTQAGAAGDDVNVLVEGQITEPSWNWAPGLVYLGVNGLLTQTPPAAPSALFLAVLGFAISATTLVWDPQAPIQLT